MKKSNVFGIIAAVLVVVIAIALVSYFFIGDPPTLLQGETDAKSFKASSKIPGRIELMAVKEGQKVKKGDLLYELSTPEIDAKMRQAKALEAAAMSQEKKALKGARLEEVNAAREVWMAAQAQASLADKSYQRVKTLYEEGVLPAQKYDEADALRKAATAQAAAAKSTYDMALKGARPEDKAGAEALVAQAAAAVSEVQIAADDARVYAPFDGEVATIISEEGELVGQGYPVVTLYDMSDIWVTYNIKENLMPKIKTGLKFTAYVPALGKDIEFEVDYISAQADFATWSATRTQGSFDIRTFAVRTRPTKPEEGLRPGMTAVMNWDEL